MSTSVEAETVPCPFCGQPLHSIIRASGKVHELKLQKQFVHAVYFGEKQFEIRKNDRDFQVGDVIVFRGIDEDEKWYPSLLDGKMYVITHVLSGWGLLPGYVALGIRQMTREERAERRANRDNV